MFQLKEKKQNVSHPLIQTSLKIGQPGDKYEQEADAVADRVMRMSENETMQMQPIEEEEEELMPKLRMQPLEEEEALIQRKIEPEFKMAPDGISDNINLSKQKGQSLSFKTNQFMSNAFGTDFSNVKIHSDSKAVMMNEQLGARAFTHGNDIYFNNGEFNPESSKGKRLLAHELTHVNQQSNAQTKKKFIQNKAEHCNDIVANSKILHTSISPEINNGFDIQKQDLPAEETLDGLTATRVAFNNTGSTNANNCSALAPLTLGVDQPETGLNGMEMIFRIDGDIPAGTEFDITRTVTDGLWDKDAAGNWSRLGGLPAGTSDDRHDADECLTPVGKQIFVLDTPGMSGTLNPRGRIADIGPVSATATAAVWKLSFAEWVIARNRRLGINWKSISVPTFHRWHSILSVALVGGTWTRVNTPGGSSNEIELGSTRTTGDNP